MARKKDHINVEIRPIGNHWRLELLRVAWNSEAYPLKVEKDTFDTIEEAEEWATIEIEALKENEQRADAIEKRTVRYQVQL